MWWVFELGYFYLVYDGIYYGELWLCFYVFYISVIEYLLIDNFKFYIGLMKSEFMVYIFWFLLKLNYKFNDK